MMKEGEIMPHIHGLNKTTLLDYPGRVAATVFLGGCNFRCPFCQNSSLVLHPSEEPEISEEEVKWDIRSNLTQMERSRRF